ncbi:hypothetical protein M9H77_12794 [Catharanthus roseus]|uniref:Uncharacterized protein n=1 Tax=Catharanthus roseus TaxID=4058 RepID=A0ACC0BIE9_CATRO|nr:hypothetical protein M9H77_12794 [Catharanthus roseus]
MVTFDWNSVYCSDIRDIVFTFPWSSDEEAVESRDMSENDENVSRWQKDSTYRGWQGNLPLIVGAEDGRAAVSQDLPRTVGLTLYVGSRLDNSQGCLELRKEEPSRATDWGLTEAID